MCFYGQYDQIKRMKILFLLINQKNKNPKTNNNQYFMSICFIFTAYVIRLYELKKQNKL